MTRFRFIFAALVLLRSADPANGESLRYAIGVDSIANAVSSMGLHVVSDQVTLLADVVSKSHAPHLRVRSIERALDHGLLVRLDCETSDQCLPFYARIRSNDSSAATLQLPLVPPIDSGKRKVVSLRKGSPAILLLDGEHVHVKLSVVCLEDGNPGQKIRVASGDRKQIYLAEVVDANLLKGTL